ncbi:hypothetical protein AHAS_Ahas01G0040400 [Arachis hypogaea]
MASTIPQVRQLVNHKHVLVNAKDEQKLKVLIQNSLNSAPCEELPNHLILHPFQYKGLRISCP